MNLRLTNISGEEKVKRIFIDIKLLYFVVQMRSGRAAGSADLANFLAAFNGFTRSN
jgi:hypothetical protein